MNSVCIVGFSFIHQLQVNKRDVILCTGFHCVEGNPVPNSCMTGHYCPNSDLSGYGPQPCPRLHYRDIVGAEQVGIRCLNQRERQCYHITSSF